MPSNNISGVGSIAKLIIGMLVTCIKSLSWFLLMPIIFCVIADPPMFASDIFVQIRGFTPLQFLSTRLRNGLLC